MKRILYIISIFPMLTDCQLVTPGTFINGYTTTATAAGTTTLTVSSQHLQYFTGTSTQTVVLPVVSTLSLGFAFEIDNLSTGNVTVQSSGTNTIVILAGGSSAIFTCIAITGTGTSSWSYWYGGQTVSSGKLLTVSNSLTLAGTDGKGINIGAASLGKIFIGDNNNMVLSTPTWPTAAPALGEVPMGDATNFVSTYSGWSYVKTLASDFTVTNAGLTDVTGMSFAVNANESWYVEVEYACSANNTTGDIIQDLVSAAGTFTTTTSNAEGVHYSAAGALTNRVPAAFSSTTSAQSATLVVNDGDGVIRVCRMIYEFTCSAGTTVKLQIGVGTPSGGRTATIYANARMMARRIR